MKSTKRAWRRHHRARLKARAEWMFSVVYYRNSPELLERLREWARRNYGHLAKCSCWMCGNARKWHGPPLQERRLWAVTQDETGEADNERA